MSSNYRSSGEVAAVARHQALVRTLTVERFGGGPAAISERVEDAREDEAIGAATPRNSVTKSYPQPVRRKYRGWSLASRRS